MMLVFPRSAEMVFLTEFQHCYFWLGIQQTKRRTCKKYNLISWKKKPFCFCFGATNWHRDRKALTYIDVHSVHPNLLYLKIPTEYFSGKSCPTMLGSIALAACLRIGCILRNFSVALLFWGVGKETSFCKTSFCSSELCAALQCVPHFTSQIFSFAAYSPSHDASFAFSVKSPQVLYLMYFLYP